MMSCRAGVEVNSGYEQIDDKIESFTPVIIEIETLAREMQKTINKLES